MNNESFTRLVRILRRHDVRLFGAAGLGAALLLVSLSALLLPQAAQSRMVEAELDQQLRIQAAVEKRPIPVKVSQEEIRAAVEQVPVQEEAARLLLTLRQLEQQSKVVLQSVTFGDNSASSPEAAIFGAALASPSPSATPGAAATPSPGASPNPQNAGGAAFVEEKLTLHITGTYGQIMEYIGQLQKQPRIVTVKQWSLTPYKDNTPLTSGAGAVQPEKGSSTAKLTEASMQAQLTLGVYSAPQYRGKFQELPKLKVEPGANRQNPSWTDEMLYELIQPTQP